MRRGHQPFTTWRMIAIPNHISITQRRLTGACARMSLRTIAAAAVMLLPAGAYAQSLNLDLGPAGGPTERALQLIALITILSLAPAILIMVTSFTRIIVVLSLLRSAIGLQTTPPNSVMIGLSLFLTAFVMAPTGQEAYDTGIAPLLAGKIEMQDAFEKSSIPVKRFMLKHVREKDLTFFVNISREPKPPTPDAVSLTTLVPAFMISELRRAFEIGFLIYMPFMVIDLIVASILMSVGMMMMPPTAISLPFKLIFFVLVDGWSLIAGSLIQSYGG